MTDTVNQEEATPTDVVKEVNNVLAISYEGNSVNVQIKQGLAMWEVLGLLKTAEQIVISKYNMYHLHKIVLFYLLVLVLLLDTHYTHQDMDLPFLKMPFPIILHSKSNYLKVIL